MAQEESSFFTEPEQVAMPAGIDGIALLYESAGGAFRVFVARHHGRKVVLKAIKPARQADAVALAQLHKEYALGFIVDSPAVCRTLAWHTLPDGIGPAIEMEYCEGASLRLLLDSGATLNREETGAIISGTLDALAAIHAAGIVHRDIKPANIIFDRPRLSAKVIDLGCADTADYALLKSPAGTPLYTPPDKQAGSPTPLPADDLYALGITVAELAQAADSTRHAAMLRRFGRDLCRGRYATAQQAAAAFRQRATDPYRAWRRTLWWAVPAVIAAIAAYVYIPRQANKDHIAQSASTPAADTLPTPTDTIPPAETPVPVQPEAPKVTKSEAPKASQPEAPKDAPAEEAPKDKQSALEDELAIEQYTLAAGQLLANSSAGLTTPTEEADAEVMRFADSLYRADIMYPYLGKEFSYDTLCTMATEFARQYDAQLYRRFPDAPPGYDPARRRAILRGRFLCSLRTYHIRLMMH